MTGSHPPTAQLVNNTFNISMMSNLSLLPRRHYELQFPLAERSSRVSTLDNFDDDDDSVLFKFILFKIVVPTVFGIISTVGIVGNALVVYVILSKRQMRTVTNVLLLNLAFADLCFVLIIPPMTAYALSTSTDGAQWLLGDVACRLMHYLVNVTAYVTVYTLVLVSAVRYMTVVHSVRTARLRTVPNVVGLIVCIWVVMLCVNGPILSAYHVEKPTFPTWTTFRRTSIGSVVAIFIGEMLYFCTTAALWTDNLASGFVPLSVRCMEKYPIVVRNFFGAFFALGYVVPLTVIGVFSLCILHYITRHRVVTSTPGGLDNNRSSARRKRQASRLLVLVVVIFAVLWLPLNVHLLIIHFVNPSDKIVSSPVYLTLSVLWTCLAYSNSCVNPFIYDHMSKDFRDAFREVMRCSASTGGGGGQAIAAGAQGSAPAASLKSQQKQHRRHQNQQLDQEGVEHLMLPPVSALPLVTMHQTRVELDGFERCPPEQDEWLTKSTTLPQETHPHPV